MGLKNKPKSLGQFIIDLTPLLDIIFILLIVVMVFQDDFSKEADAVYAQAQQIEQEALDRVSAAENSALAAQEQLDTYEHIHDYVNVITIYADYKPSNIKYRTLHVRINANNSWERIINPSNEGRIWDECREYIETELAEKSGIPTVFSIMNEKMLYRDEQEILALYEKLNIQGKYEKNNTETDNE